MLCKATKGKAVGKTIRRLKKDEGSQAYDAVLEYNNKHGADGGEVTAAYDCINSLKVTRVTCGGMTFYLTTLEEQFDALVDEGENITENSRERTS